MLVTNAFASADDKRRFEQLYVKYGRLMLSVAMEMTHRRDLAEDSVHDAFLSIARHMDRVTDVDAVETRRYVMTVLRTCAIKQFRQTTREVSLDDPDTGFREQIAPDDPERESIDRERAGEMVDRVRALPGALRDALLLYAVHGLDYDEIADMMGVTEATVRKRISRARQYLMRGGERRDEDK